jgi:hypothetical protein
MPAARNARGGHGRSGGGETTRSLNLFAALALALAFPASPAAAGKTDDAWARCIWEQVPTSTSNWLAMPVPEDPYGGVHVPSARTPVPPEYILQFRLQAACFGQMTAPGDVRPRKFNAKAVRRSLEAIRPASVGPDKVDPKAYRCTRYFLNDTEMKNPAGYDWGFGSDTSQAQLFSIMFMFAAERGSVLLPSQGGLRKCAFIQADGTFDDAKS